MAKNNPNLSNIPELPQEIAQIIDELQNASLKLLGQLVSNLHLQLQNYPDIEIKPYLSDLKG